MSGLSALGASLLGVALKGGALLALGGLCAIALRRRSAAERHAVWWIALVGSLALPAASALLPSWRAPLVSEVLRVVTPSGASDRPTAPGTPDAAVSPGGMNGASAMHPRRPAGEHASADDPLASGRAGPVGEDAFTVPARAGAPEATAERTSAERADAGWGIAGWGVAAWAVGALLCLLGLVAQRVRVERLGRRARTIRPSSRLSREARRVAERMGLRRLPRLRMGDAGAMPMTWGVRRPVLLLPPEAAAWTDARLEAVLLHELAHVRRRDYLTQLVGAVACALHWFDPLAWIALVRLRRERELACDDEVLRAGSRPSGYATELLELARARRSRPSPPLGALAMARRSQLSGRLLAVLDETRDRSRLTGRLLARAAGIGLLALVPLAALAPAPFAEATAAPDGARFAEGPANGADAPTDAPSRTGSDGTLSPSSQEAPPWLPASTPPCADPDRPAFRRVNEREGNWSLEVRREDCRFELELVRGAGAPTDEGAGEPLVFDATFREIARMEPGSSLAIRSRDERDGAHRLVARPGPDGRPTFRYWRNGEEAAFEGEAAEWLAGALVSLLRRTGLQATARTRYILRLGGVDGVLWEVDRIGSDRVQTLYLLALVDEAELDEDDLDRVLRTAEASIGSDSTMRDLLVRLVARRPGLLRGDGWPAFRRATATVGSDSEHRTLLLALLDLQGGDAAVRERLLASARGHIGSDSEMRHFLVDLGERYPSELGEPRYWSTAATIGSDSELRTTLFGLARSEITGPRSLGPALEAARAGIGSDSEMTTFVVRLVRSRPDVTSGPAAERFWECVATIGSDGELARALLAVADEAADTETLRRSLAAARRGLGSDGEMARFLVALASRHRAAATGALRDDYRAAAATIGSESERERALAPLAG